MAEEKHNEDKPYIVIISIVAIVGIVAIVIAMTGKNSMTVPSSMMAGSFQDSNFSNLAGAAKGCNVECIGTTCYKSCTLAGVNVHCRWTAGQIGWTEICETWVGS